MKPIQSNRIPYQPYWLRLGRCFLEQFIVVQVVLVLAVVAVLFGYKSVSLMNFNHDYEKNHIIHEQKHEGIEDAGKSEESNISLLQDKILSKELAKATPKFISEPVPVNIIRDIPKTPAITPSIEETQTVARSETPQNIEQRPESVRILPVTSTVPLTPVQGIQARFSSDKEMTESNAAAIRESKIRLAESLLQESQLLLERDPSRSLLVMLHAVGLYGNLQQTPPDKLDWGVKQSMAALLDADVYDEKPYPTAQAMAVSPDHRKLFIAGQQNELWIFDLAVSQPNPEKRVLFGTSGKRIVRITFTPDGEWVITGKDDGTISLWKIDENNSTGEVPFGEKIPNLKSLQVSPDGKWLAGFGYSPEGCALAPDSNTAFLWDLSVLNRTIPKAVLLRGHERSIRALTISDDSRWLVTGSDDATARVYDLQSGFPGVQQTILRGHEREITSIVCGHESRWIATGSRDNTIRVWGINDSIFTPLVLRGHTGWVNDLAISSDGKWLASAGFDQTVRIWSTEFSTPPIVLGPIDEVVDRVDFSPDGKTLVAKERMKSLVLWSLANKNTIERPIRFGKTGSAIDDFAMSGDNRWLILSERHETDALHSNGGVRLWPLRFEDMLEAARKFQERHISTDQRHQSEKFVRDMENLLIIR